ncbi:MAG: AAA family ATPase [Gallionellaceae bacterium]
MSQAGLQNQKQLIAALLDPAVYPHQAKTVRLIETHISWVLLAGRYAYKIKKALDLGFLDATTLESRHHYCAEELRLNRRLAPQLYLGVVAIGGSHTHPEWDAQPAIEYAVKMRRFASAKTFDRLIARGKISTQHMNVLANTLAHFHTQLPATTADTADIHSAITQNFSQLSGLLTDDADLTALSTLQQASERAYSTCQQRLSERSTRGFVRECHGDLHLGNIALIGSKPTPFDGIDFNSALRWIDVMDEVAFLFMDLLHHRHPELAYRFLNAYLELTGDYAGVELLNFYCAYRATVRAKVNAIRANQASISQKSKREALTDCRNYLNLANVCLTPQHPRLLITHGLPGSGKSTFAQAALERMGAIRLRSDVERKRLFGLSALEKSRTDQDIYSADATQRTYAHLLATAHTLLSAGHTVIVDAAFLKHDEREMFRKLAAEIGAAFAIVSMQADDATLHARILQRQHDASEANLNVLKKLQAAQEPLSVPETHYTATFNDGTNSESAWSTLEKLLHSYAPTDFPR